VISNALFFFHVVLSCSSLLCAFPSPLSLLFRAPAFRALPTPRTCAPPSGPHFPLPFTLFIFSGLMPVDAGVSFFFFKALFKVLYLLLLWPRCLSCSPFGATLSAFFFLCVRVPLFLHLFSLTCLHFFFPAGACITA
jgi:hypothetical protein